MMDNNDIRLSIPPGTVLKGQNGQYKVINILCISDRSVTLSSTDTSGNNWRLKVFSGKSAVTKDIQLRLLSISVSGTMRPHDIGDYSGLKFTVYPEIAGVTSMEQYPVSIQVLRNKVIPQISNMMDQD